MTSSPVSGYEPKEPRSENVVLGFILAPFVSALLLAFLWPLCGRAQLIQTTILYCIFGAYPLAIVFGIPTYNYCRFYNVRPTWLNCAMAGACIAGCPCFLVLLLMAMSSGRQDMIREDGHNLLVNGHTTLFWYLYGLVSLSQILAVAFIGGLVFWLAMSVRSDGQSNDALSGN